MPDIIPFLTAEQVTGAGTLATAATTLYLFREKVASDRRSHATALTWWPEVIPDTDGTGGEVHLLVNNGAKASIYDPTLVVRHDWDKTNTDESGALVRETFDPYGYGTSLLTLSGRKDHTVFRALQLDVQIPPAAQRQYNLLVNERLAEPVFHDLVSSSDAFILFTDSTGKVWSRSLRGALKRISQGYNALETAKKLAKQYPTPLTSGAAPQA